MPPFITHTSQTHSFRLHPHSALASTQLRPLPAPTSTLHTGTCNPTLHACAPFHTHYTTPCAPSHSQAASNHHPACAISGLSVLPAPPASTGGCRAHTNSRGLLSTVLPRTQTLGYTHTDSHTTSAAHNTTITHNTRLHPHAHKTSQGSALGSPAELEPPCHHHTLPLPRQHPGHPALQGGAEWGSPLPHSATQTRTPQHSHACARGRARMRTRHCTPPALHARHAWAHPPSTARARWLAQLTAIACPGRCLPSPPRPSS